MRSLVAALTLFALNAHAATGAAAGPATATVAVTKGRVMIHRAPSDVVAKEGLVLKEDDEVQVPPGGMAVLLLSNGYPVRVDEDLNLAVHDIELRNAPPIDSVGRLNAALSPKEEQDLGISLAGVQARIKGNSANAATAAAMDEMPRTGPGAGGVKGAPPTVGRTGGGLNNPTTPPGAPPTPQPEPQTGARRTADVAPPPPPAPPKTQVKAQPRDKVEAEEKPKSEEKNQLGNEAPAGHADDGTTEQAKEPHDSKLKQTRRKVDELKKVEEPRKLEKLRTDSEAGKVIAAPAFQKCLKDGFPAELPHGKIKWGVHVGNGVVTQVAFDHGVAVPDACRLQLMGKHVHHTEAASTGWVWMSLP